MLKTHSKIAFSEHFNEVSAAFQEGMLEIEELLTKQLDMTRYPLYFES